MATTKTRNRAPSRTTAAPAMHPLAAQASQPQLETPAAAPRPTRSRPPAALPPPAPGEAPAAGAAEAIGPGPGVMPPRTVQSVIPDLETVHYTDLFPDTGPQPVESAPGVWVNHDGTAYVPRQRPGGQYAALYLVVKTRFGNRERGIGLPLMLHDRPQEWPLDHKRMEHVVRKVQVIFDFEDEQQAFLSEFNASTADPMAQRLARKAGGDARLYDAEHTTPKTRFNNAL